MSGRLRVGNSGGSVESDLVNLGRVNLGGIVHEMASLPVAFGDLVNTARANVGGFVHEMGRTNGSRKGVRDRTGSS